MDKRRKLARAQVKEARALYASKTERWTLAELAARYGVTTNAIAYWIRGAGWKGLPPA